MALLREGQTIRETYEVERMLGEGAFGEVYRVRHRFLGRQALKVFKTPGLDASEIDAMLTEARLLSAIGHPNIIRVFDANIVETSAGPFGFFTMEHVAGGSLEQFWQSFGSSFVPLETVVSIALQTCRGLSVAHGEKPPVVHRDIKPQNILVGYDATGLRVRVSDFGLAKRVNPLTLMASARGTRCFKSPEAFRDWQSDSCAGDVWAIGCTLYLLLTDRLPYPDAAMEGAGPGAFEASLIPPSRLNIVVDPAIERIVLKALALEPNSRYKDAIELLADLEKWREPSRALPSSPGGASSKDALGAELPLSGTRARAMAARAVELAKSTASLSQAADMMEEAFNLFPGLREEYGYQVSLWRRGIAM